MKKILVVEGNLREANQEFTDNGIKSCLLYTSDAADDP